MKQRTKQSGFTLTQLIVSLAIMVIIMLISVPAFSTMIARSRTSAATRTIMGDMLTARSMAVGTGWQTKIIGFGNASTDTKKNQYRMLARQNTGVSWPADTAADARTTTTWAEPWVNVPSLYPGVTLDPGGASGSDRFDVMFDARGAATLSSTDFAPCRVLGSKDALNITLSLSGGLTTSTGTFP